MIPDSIQSVETQSLDDVWVERLKRLNVNQLIIRVENENNGTNLDYLSEQQGIPLDLFNFSDMTAIEWWSFLQKISKIKRLSGTKDSMEALAISLGATSATIKNEGWTLLYDAQALYDGTQIYDGGEQLRRFVIDVDVWGVRDEDTFARRYKKAFQVYQPCRYFLRNINLKV